MRTDAEELYRLIIDNVNDIISVFDENLNLIYINDVHQKVSGFSNFEVLGRRAVDFIHPDDINRSIKLFQETIKIGEGFGEFRLRRKDGTYIWLEANAKIIVDKNGETKAILISRDINERKLIETKLKKSEEKYRLITENANDIILVLNQKLECEYINERVSIKLLGYNNEELIGNSVLGLIHQEDLKNASVLFRNSFNNGKGKAIVRVKTKNGNYAWFNIRGKNFIDENGLKKGLFHAMDITEQKQAEEKYQHLFESSPFSITLLTIKGEVIDCNPAVEKLIGYRREELINKNFKDLSIVHPKYLPILLKRFERSKEGESLPSIDIQLYNKDGTLIWINYITSLFNIGNKKLIQIIFYDITERRKAGELLMKEMKKLKELDHTRDVLITRISHELKTPLMSICGATELLLSFYNENLGEKEIELIEMIERGSKRLKYLVQNIVDMSRLKYKKFPIERQVHDITEIIRECIRDHNLLIKKQKIDLTLNLLENLFLNVDRIRIEQVIGNLLSNAIKNTTLYGKIKINLQKIKEWAVISINDNGIGLTKDEIEKLFTRFGKLERGDQGLENADMEGAGLGLYISKEIVKLHGGQIVVESSGRHKGSTFIVKLPIK